MTKIKSLTIENFAGLEKVSVSFDDNLTYLVGPNGSGKTSIMNAIWFMFQGVAERPAEKSMAPLLGERFRFLKEGETTRGFMVIHDSDLCCDITVKRKMTKDETKVSFEAERDTVSLNQKWLTDLFNVMMISPDRFTELTSKQQTEVIGIDLSEEDKKIKDLKEEYTIINRKLKDIGTPVQVEKVERVNLSQIIELKDEYIDFNNIQTEKQANIDTYKKEIDKINETIEENNKKIRELSEINQQQEKRRVKGEELLNSLPIPEQLKNISVLDQQIAAAAEINEKAKEYENYIKELGLEETLKNELKENKQQQEGVLKMRINKIKSMELPFDNLSINEEGELLLNERPIKKPYFSKGQLLKIVPALLSKNAGKMKWVFIEDGNLLDKDMMRSTIEYLEERGFQIVMELVDHAPELQAHIIEMKECRVVNEYDNKVK